MFIGNSRYPKILSLFLPKYRKILGLSENGFNGLIRFIYIVPPTVTVIWIICCFHPSARQYREFLLVIGTGIFSYSYIFSIFSSFFYIPILISIRKLSHLTSAQLNKPQRYVLWQLVVLGVEKVIALTILFFTTDTRFEIICAKGSVFNVYCFPLIIELTYLGCNKRNLDTFLGSFDNKWMRKIVSLLCRSTLKVAPQQNIYSINS
uniref:Serpentine receptor class gamma n=1 Tax=Caenorhabditis tropicalis TaxID=1561998 RepID=A0A1I7TH45_9PELO